MSDATTWAWIYVLSEWVIRIVMLVVVPFRRTPAAAKGWLLLVFFLPWVGLILYLLIGRPRFPRWRQEQFNQLPTILAPVIDRLRIQHPAAQEGMTSAQSQIAVLATNLGSMPLRGGNEIEMITDYDGVIDRLVADIDAAKNHVHLLFYIFADDATGRRVAEALGRASQRCVSCKVLIDAVGSRRWAKSLKTVLAEKGVSVQEALPVGLFRRRLTRFDLRNHRKIAVIDGQIGYTGSQNLVDKDFKKGIEFDEVMVRVLGEIVLDLQLVFVADWYLETDQLLDGPHFFPEKLQSNGTVTAQGLASGPDFPTSNVQRLILALVINARERVVLTAPYFIPDEPLLHALEIAAARGVEVHLVVSGIADQFMVYRAQRSYYEELAEAGIHIHLYRERFLHAKHLSVDQDLALIGSSNLDIRSFVLNSEFSLLFHDREVTSMLRAEQERCFANSDLLLLDDWRRRSMGEKFVENLARLMSPLL
jgi:cardiolipin synthase